MKKIYTGAVIAICLSLAGVSAQENSTQHAPDDPIAKVNGRTLTWQDFRDYAAQRTQQQTNQPPSQDDLLRELVDRELLVQDALRRKIEDTPEYKEQLEAFRYNLLVGRGVQSYLEQNPIGDEELKKQYDERIGQVEVPKEYKARHILLPSEEEAVAVIASLDAGGDFGELAKAQSQDAGSAAQNGELGWVSPQQVVPEFGAALAAQEQGEYGAAPVQSQFGWHVIAYDEVRTSPQASFENVKENVRGVLQIQQMQDYIASLKEGAEVELMGAEKAAAE